MADHGPNSPTRAWGGARAAAWVCAATLLATGCASSITGLQPARLTPTGHVAFTPGVSVNVPVGATGDSFDTLTALGDVSGNLDPEELETVAGAASALANNPPAADVHFNVAWGASRRLELNARVGATTVGLGARVQFLRVRPGIYGVLGLTLTGGFSTVPISRFSDRLNVDLFRRFELGVPLLFGYSSSSVHLWAGPKVTFAATRVRATVCLRENDDCADQANVWGGGRAVYTTGQIGIALGKRRFWVALELNVGRFSVNGHMRIDARGRVERYAYQPAGLVVQPAIGLIAWF